MVTGATKAIGGFLFTSDAWDAPPMDQLGDTLTGA